MKIKRLYHDMRIGQTVIFPILSMVNFVIISYSLTDIKNIISMQFYVPIIITVVIISLVLIGNQFRHRQQPTDFKLAYEKNTEFAKTMLVILRTLPQTREVKERINYHEEIILKTY